jgi:hypothetical protein
MTDEPPTIRFGPGPPVVPGPPPYEQKAYPLPVVGQPPRRPWHHNPYNVLAATVVTAAFVGLCGLAIITIFDRSPNSGRNDAQTATSGTTGSAVTTPAAAPAAAVTAGPATSAAAQPNLSPRPRPTTTRPTAPRTSAKPPPSNCDPAYPTVCIPPLPPDLDCGDITHRNFVVRPPDPHKFDGDKDGIGCES